MNQIIEMYKEEFEKVIEHFKKEISNIRTGRANASLVEDVMVEAYGASTPIKQLASISIPDAKTIVVEPWDKSIIKELEKALHDANLGITPIAEANLVRLSIPALTEESRKELVKVLGQKIEQGRIGIRKVRDEIKEEILKSEKEKEISEDEKFNALEDLDKETKENNEEIKKIGDEKEKEIMTI